ncbi:MAG: preprotein translocase subunit SecY, partial [archaeon]
MNFFARFDPLFKMLPEIKAPEKAPPLSKKLLWTSAILLIFFIMGEIQVLGLDAAKAGPLLALQQILASKIGTLITAGIGPIVLASIILQLLVGAKILPFDLSKKEDKARFSSLQKMLAIIMSFFEAAIYTFSGLLIPLPGMFIWVVLQVALGSIILLYLDEVTSKYGIGSGISLFIAAGVSQEILWRIFAPYLSTPTGIVEGILSQFIGSFSTGINFLLLVPIIATIAVFFVVVYFEGIHVNIPIAIGAKGFGGRFPVKFLYVSNLPVILAVALFANIQLWSIMTAKIPIIGAFFGAIAYLTTSPFGLLEKVALQVGATGLNGFMIMGPDILQALAYLAILVAACVVFGKFWVEMAGQGPSAVAAQLDNSGMYVPG